MRLVSNLSGKIFGRLTVIKHVPGKGWECKCLCGKTAVIREYYFKQIKYPTCGRCKTKETYPLEYKSWDSMRQRCTNTNNPDYAKYGGRGIKICQRWMVDFYFFLEDMGTRPSINHTLDRIDVNGNYEKNNCRWANKFEQANNKTNTKKFDPTNIIYTPNGYFK